MTEKNLKLNYKYNIANKKHFYKKRDSKKITPLGKNSKEGPLIHFFQLPGVGRRSL